MILPALLLAGALALVAWSAVTGKSFAGRIAALAGHGSRARMIAGWAAGIFVSYGLTVVVALALLGRLDTIAAMPRELRRAAWRIGLSAATGGADLARIGAALAAGAALGVTILWWRARRGLALLGLRYRSPAAIRARGEWPAALLLSLSAGVSEEAFFRLAIPLLVAMLTGDGLIGCAIGLAAFVAAHRHQGAVPMIAVALVGGGLTLLYLATGQLWLVVLLHVLIDVNALILRPLATSLRAAS